MIRLLLSDLDGTLLPFGQLRADERTLQAIEALENASIRFAPASGRPPFMVAEVFPRGVDVTSASVCAGGALAYLDGENIVRKPLDKDAIMALRDVLGDDLPCAITLTGINDDAPAQPQPWLLLRPSSAALATLDEAASHFKWRVVQGMPEGDLFNAELVYARDDGLSVEIERRVAHAGIPFDLPRSGPVGMDVHTKGWGKGQAAEVLMERLGLTQNEVAFVGDSDNDLPMFAVVKQSFCCANGSENALSAAWRTVPSVAEHGAVRLMEGLAASGGDLTAALEDLA